jgi:hypothetical protein
MSPLIYERLVPTRSKNIRLLKVRFDKDGGIECELSRHPLQSNPKYYALSYVWGDAKVTKNILVNGKSFAATINLVAALEALATRFSETAFIWVDAICINQTDIDEKISQVGMMSTIFRNAKLIIAWLGPEEENSNDVIAILQEVVEKIGSPINTSVDVLSTPASHRLLNRLKEQAPDTTLLALYLGRANDFLALFTERPFWTRAWIFQELALARNVTFICGQASFDYNHIGALSVWLTSLPRTAKPKSVSWVTWTGLRSTIEQTFTTAMRPYYFKLRTIAKSKGDLPPKGATSDFWEILQDTTCHLCTDSRDKVYSLLGLAKIGMQADYTKSTAEVFYDIATIMVGNIPLHEWLSLATDSMDGIIRVPTWVIDWDSLSKNGQGFRHRIDGNFYNADAGIPESFNSKCRVPLVFVKHGILCQTINSVDEVPSGINDNFHWIKNQIKFDLSGGMFNGIALSARVPPGIPRGQASLRLIMEDRHPLQNRRWTSSTSLTDTGLAFLNLLRDDESQTLNRNYLGRPEIFHDFFLGDDFRHDLPEVDRGSQDYVPVDAEAEIATLSKICVAHFGVTRHFYTSDGYLGFGSRNIQKGDCVCVLQGCRVPVLLRKVSDHYHFVSTCFVLGLMDGEAIQMVQKGEALIQQFNIH